MLRNRLFKFNVILDKDGFTSEKGIYLPSLEDLGDFSPLVPILLVSFKYLFLLQKTNRVFLDRGI